MHKFILFAAFGWLTFSSTMHFIIDVLSPYLRGQKASTPETALSYGLDTSFALGQLSFSLLCLWLAWRAPEILGAWPVMTLAIVAGVAWFAITCLFMHYWEPKMAAGVFTLLVTGAALTA